MLPAVSLVLMSAAQPASNALVDYRTKYNQIQPKATKSNQKQPKAAKSNQNSGVVGRERMGTAFPHEKF